MPSGRSDLRFCFFFRLALTTRCPPGSRIAVFWVPRGHSGSGCDFPTNASLEPWQLPATPQQPATTASTRAPPESPQNARIVLETFRIGPCGVPGGASWGTPGSGTVIKGRFVWSDPCGGVWMKRAAAAPHCILQQSPNHTNKTPAAPPQRPSNILQAKHYLESHDVTPGDSVDFLRFGCFGIDLGRIWVRFGYVSLCKTFSKPAGTSHEPAGTARNP